MDAPSAHALLLVDDDLKLCRLVRQYLEPLGYSVSLAHNGEDGLQTALAGKFDAVILDVMMPQLDGFEVLRQPARQIERARSDADRPRRRSRPHRRS